MEFLNTAKPTTFATIASNFMMRQGFAELTPAFIRSLYLVMVRPQLDYAVQAVVSYLQIDLKPVERMQRLTARCVKAFMICNILPYSACFSFRLCSSAFFGQR